MIEVSRIGRSSVHEAFLCDKDIKLLDVTKCPVSGYEEIHRLSFQFFAEHCTECAAPECHDSCDLFERGFSGKCRRFGDGVVVKRNATPFVYHLEVLFKPWGRLLCVGNMFCVGLVKYRFLSRIFIVLGRLSYLLQGVFRFLPQRLGWKISDKIRGAGNLLPRLLNRSASEPGCLMLIVGNPHKESINLEVSVAGFEDSQGGRAYRRTIVLSSGWNRIEISIKEIAGIINFKQLFRICLIPIINEPKMLQVLYAGFVVSGNRNENVTTSTKSNRKIKLVIVDLDNTLWDGIFVENIDREIVPRHGVLEALAELDRRGILLSVASRNNFDDMKRILSNLGVWDFFLYPQISWEPKSVAVNRIINKLNVGGDAVVFVDDSEFERAEVKAAIPGIRVFDDKILPELPLLDISDVPVTGESEKRRLLYRQEESRQASLAVSHLDYDVFLDFCDIRLFLEPLNAENRQRVFELVQRTNQLNFSGNRYSGKFLEELLGRENVLPVTMRCEDKFGGYGLIGFSLLRSDAETLEVMDMMFSCRVQGKKIEHSFLDYVAESAKTCGYEKFICRFKRTARNSQAAKVFEDLNFLPVGQLSSSEVELYLQMLSDRRTMPLPAKIVDLIDIKSCIGKIK